MAEVGFEDIGLGEQPIDCADEEPAKTRELRSSLMECECYIQQLTEENAHLKRKLNILTRPSGITVEDIETDGPLLQILYANNLISKQCRQEIEDCICNVILKHQKAGHVKNKSSFQIKPQRSAFVMDEVDDPQKLYSSCVKTTSEAFKVVGSVSYFSTFSIDKLGQPLVNENPQLTDGWDIPIYHQVFMQVLGANGLDIEMNDTRPKSMCFNCGSCSHQLRDCPEPKDFAAINERRKEFNRNYQGTPNNQRYHADKVEERFAKYKPGVMSEELLAALGVDRNTLPPLIYRMRQLGYPPGWLKEAEMENSGLTLYDGNASNNDNTTDDSSQNISYDVSKLVDFPGFNIPAPGTMKDEFMHFGSIPMQRHHMKPNYAAYLSNNFPKPDADGKKRCHKSDSSPQQRKKNRSSPDNSSKSSDMDIESDPGTPYGGVGGFKFQPPPPPGSPCISSPPPLPHGTPPATPTPPLLPKGTPPPTPNKGSPSLRGESCIIVDETVDEPEDDLTLEELEEQQRLIWAALENVETATNSDSETPAVATPVPSSPSVSTSALVDTETEEAEEAVVSVIPTEALPSCENQREQGIEENPGPLKVEEDSPQSPEPIKPQDHSPQSPSPVKSNDNPPISNPNMAAGGNASPKHATISAVPHRSKFAAGIVPFEDTPEFTEVAKATGTYLRISSLLKDSPRKLAKKNKTLPS